MKPRASLSAAISVSSLAEELLTALQCMPPNTVWWKMALPDHNVDIQRPPVWK